MPETSGELLRRGQAGDQAALTSLFEMYLPRLYRWAKGRLPRRARGLVDTDDLVQETLRSGLGRVADFEPRGEGAFLAYLRQAFLNRLRDEIRRVDHRPRAVAPDENLVDPGPSPLEETIGREALQRYEHAMNTLRREDREAIVARIEMGFTYKQLAEALGKPSQDAARVAVGRALVRLAREMGHER